MSALRVIVSLVSLISLIVLGAGCERADTLSRLKASLRVTPDQAETTVWVGRERVVPFSLENTGAARVHVNASALRVEGAPAALEVELRAREAIDTLEGGAAVMLDVVLRADSALADTSHALTLIVPAQEQGLADARATLEVAVRTPPPCAPNDACEVTLFDDESGECVRTFLPDNTPCDDASACTERDRCSAGTCLGVALTCEDEVDCTLDSCDPARGCVFEPVRERCADGNACTADICDPTRGCENPTSPDGTPCGPFSCAQFEVCSFGACTAWPTPEGFPCEDGDLCTVGDTCQAQACAPGAPTLPEAQPPVTIARPVAHVGYELRWMLVEQLERPSTVPETIDVPLTFGAVLDVEQGVVGFTPHLVVLWKSDPFDVHGAPCLPWQPLATIPSATDAQFCATAVVATFIEESALRGAARGEVVGESVVLEIAYGVVDAAFVHRSAEDVVADLEAQGATLDVTLAESTYFPGPLDPARLLHVHHMTLSLDTRSATSVLEQWSVNTPHSALESNVHAGLRVGAVRAGEAVSLVGWDLPRTGLHPGSDSADVRDPSAGGDSAGDAEDGAAIDEQPWIEAPQTLDAIAAWPGGGDDSAPPWQVVRSDVCPNGPEWIEEQAFRDVDLVRVGDMSVTTGMHGDLTTGTDGCGELWPLMQSMVVDLAAGTSESDGVWGVQSTSLSPSADLLARVGINSTDLGLPLLLSVDTSPFNHSDPVVTLHHASVGMAGAVAGRVAALDARTGVVGAVVAARDAFGAVVLELVEDLDNDASTHLSSEPFFGPDAPFVARRSPLSPQSVYAVATGGVDSDVFAEEGGAARDGVLVRFGCPFPSPPAAP